MKQGRFIVFEGGEGAGKTTQIRKLASRLKSRGYSVLVTRQPGGSHIGKKVRRILLDRRHRRLSSRAELLLYEADRAQHVEETIQPALVKKQIVLCDRYADSSTVYQGVCRGLGASTVKKMNHFATGGLLPDLVFILDVPEVQGLSRTKKRKSKPDRLESEKGNFHKRVRKGFLKLAQQNRRYAVINAAHSMEEVANEIYSTLQKRMGLK